MTGQRWHYTACGLDNIYLLNGYQVEKTSRGRAVRIEDLEGLHRAIGSMLVYRKRGMTGNELRFVRQELGLSQTGLAKMLGESEQTVARREKRKTRSSRPSAQERFIRYLYEQHIGRSETLAEFVNLLAELDDIVDTPIAYENDNSGVWHRADEKLAA